MTPPCHQEASPGHFLLWTGKWSLLRVTNQGQLLEILVGMTSFGTRLWAGLQGKTSSHYLPFRGSVCRMLFFPDNPCLQNHLSLRYAPAIHFAVPHIPDPCVSGRPRPDSTRQPQLTQLLLLTLNTFSGVSALWLSHVSTFVCNVTHTRGRFLLHPKYTSATSLVRPLAVDTMVGVCQCALCSASSARAAPGTHTLPHDSSKASESLLHKAQVAWPAELPHIPSALQSSWPARPPQHNLPPRASVWDVRPCGSWPQSNAPSVLEFSRETEQLGCVYSRWRDGPRSINLFILST